MHAAGIAKGDDARRNVAHDNAAGADDAAFSDRHAGSDDNTSADPDVVLNDLIWRGTEITTGAQREHRYEQLRKQADEKGLGEDVKFYMDFFRYGCPPHGGFGLGVDRLTMLLLGIPIKEVMFLFRGPNRITP